MRCGWNGELEIGIVKINRIWSANSTPGLKWFSSTFAGVMAGVKEPCAGISSRLAGWGHSFSGRAKLSTQCLVTWIINVPHHLYLLLSLQREPTIRIVLINRQNGATPASTNLSWAGWSAIQYCIEFLEFWRWIFEKSSRVASHDRPTPWCWRAE